MPWVHVHLYNRYYDRYIEGEGQCAGKFGGYAGPVLTGTRSWITAIYHLKQGSMMIWIFLM